MTPNQTMCPQCNSPLRSRSELVSGTVVQCPRCAFVFTVGASEDPPLELIEEPLVPVSVAPAAPSPPASLDDLLLKYRVVESEVIHEPVEPKKKTPPAPERPARRPSPPSRPRVEMPRAPTRSRKGLVVVLCLFLFFSVIPLLVVWGVLRLSRDTRPHTQATPSLQPFVLSEQARGATVCVVSAVKNNPFAATGLLFHRHGNHGYVVTATLEKMGPQPTVLFIDPEGTTQAVPARVVRCDPKTSLTILHLTHERLPLALPIPDGQGRLHPTLPVYTVSYRKTIDRGEMPSLPLVEVMKREILRSVLRQDGALDRVDLSIPPVAYWEEGAPVLGDAGEVLGFLRDHATPSGLMPHLLPRDALHELLSGQVHSLQVQPLTIKGGVSYSASAVRFDPWEGLASAELIAVPLHEVKQMPVVLPDGTWGPLSTELRYRHPLQLQQEDVRGVLKVNSGLSPAPGYAFQVKYVGDDDQPRYTEVVQVKAPPSR